MDVVLAKLIKEKSPTTAIELIKLVTEYDPSNVMGLLEKLAAGVDGISGTDDDLISQEILETVRILLKHDVVHDIVKEFAPLKQSCFCFN